MRLLVIEDHPELQLMLKHNLEDLGFSVDATDLGKKGSFMARTTDYDAIVLDYILPDQQGNEICREIRKSGTGSPILVVSAKSSTQDKLELFNAGADDYITKPFSFEELTARIHALLRRPSHWQGQILKIDNLELDAKKYKVTRGGKNINLTRKEFGLLEFLLSNQGSVMPRGAILEHVWDINVNIFSNTIETHILNLRRKIDVPGETKLIHTFSGRGYKIDIKR